MDQGNIYNRVYPSSYLKMEELTLKKEMQHIFQVYMFTGIQEILNDDEYFDISNLFNLSYENILNDLLEKENPFIYLNWEIIQHQTTLKKLMNCKI